MKKLALAILSTAALNANAAMYMAPKCESANVTVPCEGNAWDVGVDLLYLRNQENILSGITHQGTGEGYQADYGYGFRLEGSYHFGTGHDVNINWAHYSKTTSTTTFFTAASTEDFTSKLDVVNFELGQHMDVGEAWNMRVHGGLQYATMSNDILLGGDVAGDVGMKVRGFGPRVGMDSSYDFGNGFAIFANGAVAVLKSKLTERETVEASSVTALDNVFTDGLTRHMTTTATDARIGAMYTHAMAQGDMTIRAGYQVNNFINSNATTGVSDLSWDGWFVGLHWMGNA